MIPHPSSTGLQTWTSQPRASGIADRSSMAVAPAPSSAQQLIDLSASDCGSTENEHPHKRPRLDTNVSGLGGEGRTPSSRSADARSATTGPNPTRPTAVSGRGRPAYSFQELVADTYGGNVFSGNATPGSQTSKPPSPPPFPVRPWTHTPARLSQVENEGSSNNMRAREVQTVPYHPETPEIAPSLTRESKCYQCWIPKYKEQE
jgi:mediator of RNA polymerase II transcription subunit 12